MSEKISVIIVDDHVVLAEGIESLLREEPTIAVVGLAHNGEQALSMIDELAADVVLLDINLPDMDGLDVMQELSKRGVGTKVIALSMHEEEAFITGMIERGAQGYLLKNVSEGVLIEAIRTVHNGGTYYSKQVTQTLLDAIIRKQRASNPSVKETITISDREKEVLYLIVQEHTTDEIAEQLHISSNTVETHRRHLLEKMGARNSAGLVRIAMEQGLLG